MSHTKNLVDPNGWNCIISIAVLAAITPATVVLGPIIVGAYVTSLGFSAQQAGYLIAAELVGAGVATFVAYYAIGRFSWQHILRAALLVAMAGNLISCFLSELTPLIPIRFVTGVAVGTIMTMTIVLVGMTSDQERNFGYWSMGQVVFAVVGFAVFPHIIPEVGVNGFFLGMAVVMLLLQFTVANLPETGTESHKLGLSSLSQKAKRLAPIGLTALLFFYIGIGGVWAYVERIGNQANLDPSFVGYVLSGASVIGVAGAALATWMSTRFGRLLPSCLGYAMIGGAIAMYFGTINAVIYTVASLLFKFAWWFMSPYLLGNMTKLDPSGRIAILTNFVIAIGLGGGPAIAAWILGPAGEKGTQLDFTNIIILSLTCIAISVVLLVPVIRLNTDEKVGETVG